MCRQRHLMGLCCAKCISISVLIRVTLLESKAMKISRLSEISIHLILRNVGNLFFIQLQLVKRYHVNFVTAHSNNLVN